MLLTREVVRRPGSTWDDGDDLNLDDDLDLDDGVAPASHTEVCGGVTRFDGFDLEYTPEPIAAVELSREHMQEALEQKLEGELRLVGQLSGRPAAAPMKRLTVAFVPGGAVATGTLVGGSMAYGAVAAGPVIGAAATKAVEVTTAAAVKATAMATAAGAAATDALQRIAQPAQRMFQALQGRATEAVRGAAQATSQGFRSFSAFKRAMGPAGPGQHWHHIVEQTPGNIARFGSETIHSTGN
jgi:hypothetical protein